MFDTSALNYLRNHYPMNHPNLREFWSAWLGAHFKLGNFLLCSVVLSELNRRQIRQWVISQTKGMIVRNTTEDGKVAGEWMEQHGFTDDDVGVNANDLIVIATAKRLGATVVMSEVNQSSLPQQKREYKIPAVCREVAHVDCLNISQLLNDPTYHHP